MTVAAGGLTDVSDLVRKGHLEGMKRVVGVLQTLRHADLSTDQGSINSLEQRGYHLSRAAIQLPNHRAGGIEEVLYRRTLTQEFRNHTHAEIPPGDLSRPLLQGWNHQLFDRAWQHCAANRHHEILILSRQCGANLL